jgi:hypothetical protein
VRGYERFWSERFNGMDAVLEDLKREGKGGGGDE